MADSRQKKRIMAGMGVRAARNKFKEIWVKAHPDVSFNAVNKDFTARYPGGNLYVWFETWFRLRAHSETFDIIAQAFAEKISAMHKHQHETEKRLHLNRLELKKRLDELDSLKAKLNGSPEPKGKGPDVS